MRHQLKARTPSARARMSYILRADRYGVNQARAAELVAAGVAHLPAWAAGPSDFWAGTDGFERANARLCLELELNLPHELSRAGQVAAIADYIDRLSAEAGQFPITWGIHDDGGRNVHCHLMLQERPLDGVDRDGPKAHYKRANKKKPASGGAAKSDWWHSRENVFWSRALWADACNQALLREGHVARFDPRKKSERLDEALRAGDLRAAAVLCTQTERHEGVKVSAARKKLESGHIEADDLPEQVVQIISGNDCARDYNGWLRDWARTASERELLLFLADHLHELRQRLEAESPSGHIQARAAWLEQQHAELAELVAGEQVVQAAELSQLAAVQAAHTAALIEDSERTAELAELVQVEQSAQAAELARLGAVQSAHAAALIEDSERTAELAELVAGEADRQAAELARLGAVQAAHDAALVEDAERGRYATQLLQLVSSGTAAGWLGEDEGTELLYALIDPHTLEWLREEVAALVAADAEHAYRQWVAVQAAHAEAMAEDAQRTAGRHARPSLVEQLNAGLAGLQQSAPDLDDPATLIHHDDEPQWIEFEGQDGDVLGCWSDDPETDDCVEHDPDHRPRSGPRMG